jgi:hypothetical protein
MARKSGEVKLPRRAIVDKMTPAELAIRAAVLEVEKLGGGDNRLTDAVVYLLCAQDWVADYVDGRVSGEGA